MQLQSLAILITDSHANTMFLATDGILTIEYALPAAGPQKSGVKVNAGCSNGQVGSLQ